MSPRRRHRAVGRCWPEEPHARRQSASGIFIAHRHRSRGHLRPGVRVAGFSWTKSRRHGYPRSRLAHAVRRLTPPNLRYCEGYRDRVGGAASCLTMLALLSPAVSCRHGMTTCSQSVALDSSYAPDHQNYLCMNYTRPTPLPCRDSAQGWAPRWFDGKGRPRFIIYAYSHKSK